MTSKISCASQDFTRLSESHHSFSFDILKLDSDRSSLSSPLFPPALMQALPLTNAALQASVAQGYIPHSPNAFMLFCADFARQKLVPSSIETNHGLLSKIIGQFPNIGTF